MTRGDWIVDVDRVVVTGLPTADLDVTEIRALVTDSLTRSLADRALPDRSAAMRAAVHVDKAALRATAMGVAGAISTAVTSAVHSGGGHG